MVETSEDTPEGSNAFAYTLWDRHFVGDPSRFNKREITKKIASSLRDMIYLEGDDYSENTKREIFLQAIKSIATNLSEDKKIDLEIKIGKAVEGWLEYHYGRKKKKRFYFVTKGKVCDKQTRPRFVTKDKVSVDSKTNPTSLSAEVQSKSIELT